jgi:AAA family ATP:ADP antiporter
MFPRLRRFLDVRPGEGLPVLLTFLYIAVVVAAYLLAKPIRNGLFLGQYGPYALVYVYAGVPLALSMFVPAYSRIAARFGTRTVTVWTLLFFSANVVFFWYAFRHGRFWLLPGLFYVWVNCFGIIASVQAWNFANSLFDTRQAKRLFGLIGSGASLGAIAGGLLARVLVRRVGGTVNMMLVLAALILTAALIVLIAKVAIPRQGSAKRVRPVGRPLSATLREIAASPYLRLIATMVFLVAVATQWTAFQLSLVADSRFEGNADALTRFFGTFNVVLGVISFVVQFLVTGPALRRFGLTATILMLPLALGFGDVLILIAPAFLSVLLTNGIDQGLRFSVDKATYELLYLPIPPAQRAQFKNTIDIVVNRVADAIGAVFLGVATRGFFMLPGMGLGLRGTAAVNLVLIGAWTAVAWRLRVEYVRTIQDSIHRHRLDTERTSTATLDRSAAEALSARLSATDPGDVKYALGLLEMQQTQSWHPALRDLLLHPEAEIRRRALAILSAARDRDIADRAEMLLRDPDLGVRTEALLYLARETGVDPLQKIQQLGDFEDFSIRAGMAAFLAAPGRAQNLDAAGVILDAMVHATGPGSARERAEAARLIAMVPDTFLPLLVTLLQDSDPDVARQAIRSARVVAHEDLIVPLLNTLANPELADEASGALSRLGNAALPAIASRLGDDQAPLDLRRELPSVLVRIGTSEAEQILIEGLLEGDVMLRHRIVASLNKLRVLHPDVRVDPNLVELLLAAEIAGHYRSYQVLGPLRARLSATDPVLQGMGHAMEQELERIFRLMALLFPDVGGLHDAYVGARSSNVLVRANALEFLDNVLKPELRHLIVPLLDGQVTTEERIALAVGLVGAPLDTAEQAVTTLMASEDAWLRSCAVYAIGALQLRTLEGELQRFEDSPDPAVKENVKAARRRLAGEPGEAAELQEPAPADMNPGVGAG